MDGLGEGEIPAGVLADPRCRLLRLGRHFGAAAARNLALGLTQGRYLTSCDDDDYLPAGSLERRVDVAVQHGAAWVAGLLADDRDGEYPVWDCPAPRGHR